MYLNEAYEKSKAEPKGFRLAFLCVPRAFSMVRRLRKAVRDLKFDKIRADMTYFINMSTKQESSVEKLHIAKRAVSGGIHTDALINEKGQSFQQTGFCIIVLPFGKISISVF